MHTVINDFFDLQDNNHKYQAGDAFPRTGLEVSGKRFEELATGNNLLGKPLIKKNTPATFNTTEKTTTKKSGGKKKDAE